MRYFFDRDGNYAGSSMQGWEILLLLLFPVTNSLVFLHYVFIKWLEKRIKITKEKHQEITKSRLLY